MIVVLFLIVIITGCNGQYDPSGRLGASASPATTLQIQDTSGNVILQRAVNTDTHWKLGTIDGVDLSKYTAFVNMEYKWVAGYQWKRYFDHYDFTQDRGDTVYLLVDGNGVFNGMSSKAHGQMTTNLPTADASICGNGNIFCYPNKKDPMALLEKLTTNTGRPILLSRHIAAGHDGLDTTVHPNAKYPWRKPGECVFEAMPTLSQSCPEYEIRDEIAENKWLKIIWNLVGVSSDDPATKQKWKIVWDETTHEATWKKDGGIEINGVRFFSGPSKTKVEETTKKWGGFHVYRDKQGLQGECVMNTVNTLLKMRYWDNQQYYDEFCAPYGGADRGNCETDKWLKLIPHGKYGAFSDSTVDMALAKVGAFQYAIDINQLYSQLRTDDPHHLLGIRISYYVKGGPGGHWQWNMWKWKVKIPKFNFAHDTAFVWRGGTDNHWYYVNSHTYSAIHRYDTVLDMIQDIKKNFNKPNGIKVVRILAQNTDNLAATPGNVVRTKKMEKDVSVNVNIQIQGGGTKQVSYWRYVIGEDLAYQEYDNMYDSDTDKYGSSSALFSENGYDTNYYNNNNNDYVYFGYFILESEIILLFSIISLFIAMCCCGAFGVCSWMFYTKNKKKIKEFVVDFV